MTIQDFAKLLSDLETTASRNEMTESLAAALPQFSRQDAAAAMYMLQGQLAPTFRSIEFNLSQKLALRAVNDFMLVPESADVKFVQEKFKEFGDLGSLVENLKKSEANKLRQSEAEEFPELNSLSDLHKELVKIAKLEGKGSQEAKMLAFAKLMLHLEPLTARYVARIVIGKLRLGLSEKTMLDAFSYAVVGDKSLRSEIERAFGARADIGALAELVLLHIDDKDSLVSNLAGIKLTTGVPVASKLVEREKTAEKVFARLGEHLVQPKLDGMRAQIHFDRKLGVAEVFSRNMERLTEMFPDILEAVANLKVDSVVIDSEVIGYDFENDTYLPFQETMQRRRKYDIDETIAAIPVRAMAFDLLYLDGQDISQEPVQARIAQLKEILSVPQIDLLDSTLVKSEEELDKYFRDKIGAGLEGVICKKLDTPYDPGTRNFDWIKLKANTQSEMVDTLDVVVIGYFVGRGARAKSGIGALLTAVYDESANEYYSVAKVGSGLTDALLDQIAKSLEPLEIENAPKNVVVNPQLKPDVWIQPQYVIEVDADEITRSPSHTAAVGLKADFEAEIPEKGLSLRFPRLKVWDRDKNPEQATSVSELLRIYQLRKSPK